MKKLQISAKAIFSAIKNYLQDMRMQKTLLSLFLISIGLIWLLPVSFLGLWTFKTNQLHRENAIHHGLESKLGTGTLTLKAYITEQRLVVNVKDDGCRISQEKLEAINQALASNAPIASHKTQRISVGLSNVNSRIKFTYGDMYGINIYSTEGIGTDVQINLPLLKQ